MSLFLSLYQTDKFYVELWGYVVFFFVCFLLFFYGPNTVSCWSSPVVFCINLIWRVERKKMDQLFSVLPLNGSKVRKKVYSELFCWQISNHFAGALVSLFIWSHVGLLLTNITSNMSPLKEFVPMEGLLGKMPSQHLTVLSFYFFFFFFFFKAISKLYIWGKSAHVQYRRCPPGPVWGVTHQFERCNVTSRVRLLHLLCHQRWKSTSSFG